MFELYIANKNYSSWSLRPWVLMKELRIPFTEHLVPFKESDNWELFRKFSPSGKVPCLKTPQTTVWDSLAIIEFLAEHTNTVWPTDQLARAWARSASAEMHAGFGALRQQCPMNCSVRVGMHSVSTTLQKDIERLDELWQQGLENFSGPFLAGSQFTAADAFFCPVAFRVQTYQIDMSAPALAYAQQLLDLSSMREWDAAARAEPWIEPAHDQECRDAGRILVDYRSQLLT
jgi:glutathione S-transferase